MLPLIVDHRADDVAGQEVGGELDTLELGGQRPRQGADRQRLRQARHALQERVPIGDEGNQEPVYKILLPDDDLADFGAHPAHPLALLLDMFFQRFEVQTCSLP